MRAHVMWHVACITHSTQPKYYINLLLSRSQQHFMQYLVYTPLAFLLEQVKSIHDIIVLAKLWEFV